MPGGTQNFDLGTILVYFLSYNLLSGWVPDKTITACLRKLACGQVRLHVRVACAPAMCAQLNACLRVCLRVRACAFARVFPAHACLCVFEFVCQQVCVCPPARKCMTTSLRDRLCKLACRCARMRVACVCMDTHTSVRICLCVHLSRKCQRVCVCTPVHKCLLAGLHLSEGMNAHHCLGARANAQAHGFMCAGAYANEHACVPLSACMRACAYVCEHLRKLACVNAACANVQVCTYVCALLH